jgi:hypothetical protein
MWQIVAAGCSEIKLLQNRRNDAFGQVSTADICYLWWNRGYFVIFSYPEWSSKIYSEKSY